MHPDDEGVLEAFANLRESSDPKVRDQLVARFHWVAVHAARRFTNRGEFFDDLVQVASIGVLKAVDRFDPQVGTSFPSYAMATAVGELRRHFRDATWSVRVPRRVKEMHLELTAAIDLLTNELGRSPRVSELAARLRVTEEEILEGLEAGAAYRPLSLSAPSGGGDGGGRSVSDSPQLASEDMALSSAADRMTVAAILDKLPERERRIVSMRFFEGRTQSEIAEAIGVSQVHVSRLLRASLETMRRRFDDEVSR